MKTTISVSVDVEVVLKMKEKRINPSRTANEAFWRAVGDPSLLSEKAEQINRELDELTKIKTEFERTKVRDKELLDAKLGEFLKLPKVLENEVALEYWSKNLGRSVEELTRLYKESNKKP